MADGPIPSVDIVIQQPFAALARRGLIEFELLYEARSPGRLPSYDLVFMMRCCDAAALQFAQSQIDLGKRFVYAIDDDFESLDPSTPLGRRYRDMRAWENVVALCRAADEVWVFSDVLKRKLEPHARRIRVMPALAHVELVDRLLADAGTTDAAARTRNRKRLRFGYAAGLTHAEDLAEIAPVIRSVLERWKDELEFEVVCVPPAGLDGVPGVATFGCSANVGAFLEFMCERRWDFAVAPLRAVPVNDSKTDNKYREYSALRIPGIYSASPVYANSVMHGSTGLVAETHADWLAAIGRMVEEPDLRASIARRAHADVASRYSALAVQQSYFAAISEMLAGLRAPAPVITGAPAVEMSEARERSMVNVGLHKAISRNSGRAAEVVLGAGTKRLCGFDLDLERADGTPCAGTGTVECAGGTLRNFSWHVESAGSLRVRFPEIVNAHVRDLVIRLHSPSMPLFARIDEQMSIRCLCQSATT